MKTRTRNSDSITRTREEWKAIRPELDTEPMEVIGRILRIDFIARERIRKVLQAYELDLGGCDVLATLRRSGPPFRLSPTALYRELLLTSGAMTNRLDVLEEAGLVKRQEHPEDRRGTLIELTKKGITLIDEVMAVHLENEGKMTAALTRTEHHTLATLLTKLLQGLEERNEK